jgi:hypothetical protein
MLEKLNIRSREVSLPAHMSTLPQGVVDYLSSLDDASHRVISAGVDPKDNSLIMVTADSDVRQIAPNGKKIPAHALPSRDGKNIVITFEGYEKVYAIDSKLAIESSKSCLSDMKLSVNNVEIGSLDLEAR